MDEKVGWVTGLLLLALASQAFGESRQLICPKGIKAFSSGHSNSQYYKCDGHGKAAILTECPPGKVYKMSKSKCVKDEKEEYKPFNQPILGRKWVSLGALYDGKKNDFERSSIWSHHTIENNTYKYARKEVTTDFRADSTTVERADKFDINADLTMDFMSGQVTVSGAMSYLTDQRTTEKEMNVEMLFHTTKYTEVIPKYTKVDYDDSCDAGFTHVVTSVTYGMDANMNFKYILQESDSQEDIMGSLSVSVNAIPGMEISGSGEVNLSDHDREVMNHTTIKTFGDFTLTGSDLPVTYEEAVNFYTLLPTLMGEEAEWWPQAAPIEIHLTPITDICTEGDMILKDISEGMLNLVVNLLNDMEMLMVKANGLLITAPAIQFKPLSQNLELYRNGLDDYQGDVKRELKKLIPQLRGGEAGVGENDLTQLLTENMESPWNIDTSGEFLMGRSREISSIQFLLNTLRDAKDADNIKVADFKNAPEIGIALNYDHVLEVELKILSTKDLTNDFIAGNPQDETNFWYNDIAKNGDVGYLLRIFEEFAMENYNAKKYGFLVRLTEIEEGVDPVNVKAYDNEQSNTPVLGFNVPTAPPSSSVFDISYNNVKITVGRQNANCTGVSVIVYDAVTGDLNHVWDYVFTVADGETEDFTIPSLQPATVYYFHVKYSTVVGNSPPSTNNPRFITAPSTAPTSLNVASRSTDSIQVTWGVPSFLGSGISANDLKYSATIKDLDNGGFESTIVSNATNANFVGLSDATNYEISVIAFLPYHGANVPPDAVSTSIIYVSVSQPTTTTVFSNPYTPTLIPSLPGEVTQTSATVRWEPPRRMPDDQDSVDSAVYQLHISLADSGDVVNDFELPFSDTSKEVTGLTLDTLYEAKIKVVTSAAESEYSERLLIHTKSDKTDLDRFKDQVMDDLDDIVEESRLKSSFCASQDRSNAAGILTYDQIDVEVNTVPGANLNVGNGLFTAGASGFYQVTMSMEMTGSSSESHSVWFERNGNKIEESLLNWNYHSTMWGKGVDNGNRDMVLRLEVGDTIGLRHEKTASEDMINIVFCVNSVKLEME